MAANLTRNKFGANLDTTQVARAVQCIVPANSRPHLTCTSSQLAPTGSVVHASAIPGSPFMSPARATKGEWSGLTDQRHVRLHSGDEDGSPHIRTSISSPKTIPFSMTRAQWLRTRTKQAARHVVDNFMRTAKRSGPSANELISRRQAECEMARRDPLRGQTFQDVLAKPNIESPESSELPTPPSVTVYLPALARNKLPAPAGPRLPFKQGTITSRRFNQRTIGRPASSHGRRRGFGQFLFPSSGKHLFRKIVWGCCNCAHDPAHFRVFSRRIF